MWDEQVGARIRALRTRKRYTQKELAARTGVPIGRLREIESGKRSLLAEELYRIAVALDVSCDDILSGEGNHSTTRNFLQMLDSMEPEKLTRIKDLLEVLGDICDLA